MKLLFFFSLLFISASCIPYIIPRVRHADHGNSGNAHSRSVPPSEEAKRVAFTKFSLVQSTDDGCALVYVHKKLSFVPKAESEDVEGRFTFSNITVEGETCEGNGFLKLYRQDVLDVFLPGGKVLNLSTVASSAIFLAGADTKKRQCGAWTDKNLTSYAFTEDIDKVLPSLVANGFVNDASIPPAFLLNVRMWMVSAPQVASGRVCLYKRSNEVAEPEPTPSPEDLDDADDDDDDDEGDDDSDTDSGDGGKGTFEQANEDGEELAADGDGGECFPPSATVSLSNGGIKRMDELQIGDRVQVATDTFSEVFMFTHRLSGERHSFVKLGTASGRTLAVTMGHYIYVNGMLIPAGKAIKGDLLTLANGSVSEIVSVGRMLADGLYNPQTLHGDIVVDGVKASTYTNAVEPGMAHALLTPLRMVFRRFAAGVCVKEFGWGRVSALC